MYFRGLGEGLEELQEEITALLGTGNFDPGAGMLFTERQRHHARAALEALGRRRTPWLWA